MKYLAIRPFAHPSENRLAQAGEKITVNESTAKQMIQKGLITPAYITPAYKTKEDKKATKVLRKSADLSLKQVGEWISLGRELDFKGDNRKGVENYK